MMALHISDRFLFSRTHRLQWEEAQKRYVILYPEGIVELNPTAAEILKLCDGTKDLSQIVTALEQLFETSGIQRDVITFLDSAIQHGWIHRLS